MVSDHELIAGFWVLQDSIKFLINYFFIKFERIVYKVPGLLVQPWILVGYKTTL